MYVITGTVTEYKLGPHGETSPKLGYISHVLPLFYLHESVQGIVNTEHAEHIAKKLLNPANISNLEVNVSAYFVPNAEMDV